MVALRGRRIAVTREESEDGPLCTLIRAAGATPVLRPTVSMTRLLDREAIAEALEEAAVATWLVLTSPRSVRYLADAGVLDAPPPSALRIAAVGSGTKAELKAAGWPVHLVPSRADGDTLLAALLEAGGEPGGIVLFPASAQARPDLPEGLAKAGFRVRHVPLYEPRDSSPSSEEWGAELDAGLAALTFSSPSAVAALARAVPSGPVADRLRSLPAATQGPVTGRAAREAGWRIVGEADPHTFAGVVAALTRLLPGEAEPPRTPGGDAAVPESR